jgi:5-methylcytosine-specific restriction endonuclease McrA
MSSSYKPALLKALVRLIRRGAGHEITLPEIGREFVGLYWVQTIVFRLRQAPSLGGESEVVKRIRATANRLKVRDLHDLCADERSMLDLRMAKVLSINVLRAFHTGKPESMPLLFAWSDGEQSIRLPEEAHRFLRDNSIAAEALANLWWARYLERVNRLAPLIIEKVERLGAKRGSLARYLRILQEMDGNRCFYCERDLTLARDTHVDHVIPWSFLLSDPAWDLVLACDACNLAKSDVLPTRPFIQKLGNLHAGRAKLSLSSAYASAILPSDEINRYYDAALSVEWPSGWEPPLQY